MASMGKAQMEITLPDDVRDLLERFIEAAQKLGNAVPGEIVELEAVADDALADRVSKRVISALNDAIAQARGVR